MSSSSEISHRGRIVSITPEVTTVQIVSESACSACHAKGLCSLGDSTVKEVELPTRGWDNYQVGDEVSVVLQASMGHKAVWLAYVLPLVLMAAALLVTLSAGGSELLAGGVAIAAVALWYAVLWLLRDRLRNEYIFNIKA
ncbi:MAG: SoxR reducing system RseC family protein [Bacteroidales bacterium]|jgi:sigma-E factor negative regulatory protein RseC|nr:SoxR reducing system RseC family protein [Bacteroidales bacterium]MBR1577577.1 SoxR reducing system RseC family protein [Bacteroidales bacterium]MDO4999028.1 SoxR reducing system RseC family protein [Bacteroidales bacterium]